MIVAARGVASGIASLDSAALVPQAQIPITKINSGFVAFRTPAGTVTWTVPAGVSRIRARMWGAGGGGGFTSAGTGGDHGGGGGGGGYAEKYFDVVPGSNFTLVVGAGGTGGGPVGTDSPGADGADTILTSPASAVPASTTVTAKGGGRGFGPPTRFGGGGGQVLNADFWCYGGEGASGETRGGMGGMAGLGGPANATGSASDGVGGGGFGSGNLTVGFGGKDGAIFIEW